MSIFISNTLTKKKEQFQPVNPDEVKIYTCGVTVYDDCHIGHARSIYIFDVIKRYLQYSGYKVRFVRNITDIDDKIINKARQMGTKASVVAERFIKSYHDDLERLEIDMVDIEPMATENIDSMVKHIQGLIDKGYAYESEGDVYFSVRKFQDYGKLSGQSMEYMMTGVRKEPGEKKMDPLDFALWKSSKEDEPAWDSPWGKGRPGWHIECSVMSMKYLSADTLDIHAGGRDLVFPHHENEIAQSEALTGRPFAKYWIHHGLLTINGQKMAKSLGNFVTIKDIIKKSNANTLKLFFLSACYGNALDFTWDKLEDAEKQAKKIQDFFDRAGSLDLDNNQKTGNQIDETKKIKEKFISAMDDDFNTPEAMASIFELVDLGNHFAAEGDKHRLFYDKILLEELLDIFGVKFKRVSQEGGFIEDGVLSQELVSSLIEQRNLARQRKEFMKADEIRKELELKGIVLEDTKSGTIWRRK